MVPILQDYTKPGLPVQREKTQACSRRRRDKSSQNCRRINSIFSAARYLRSVKNLSPNRFVTVAVNQIITTNMGTTRQARLLENLAPGEERRLGHSDHVKDGKYQIYIGYEILWARYVPIPDWYVKPQKNEQAPPPGSLLQHQHQSALIKEMEEKNDLLS